MDAPLEAKPTAGTFTLRTLDNGGLDSVGLPLAEAIEVTIDDLDVTLSAANAGAYIVPVTSVVGALTACGDSDYKLLLKSGLRCAHVRVVDTVTDESDEITHLHMASGLPFEVKDGDKLTAVRVSVDIDWKEATDASFVGHLKGTWDLELGDDKCTMVLVYDIVRQVFKQPVTWVDVLDRRPDADTLVCGPSAEAGKERFVKKAWKDIERQLHDRGIGVHQIVPDAQITKVGEAVVLQTILNLVKHAGLSPPSTYIDDPMEYIAEVERDIDRVLLNIRMPVDFNEDNILSSEEVEAVHSQLNFRRRRRRYR